MLHERTYKKTSWNEKKSENNLYVKRFAYQTCFNKTNKYLKQTKIYFGLYKRTSISYKLFYSIAGDILH